MTHKFPYPYHDGGAMAIAALASGLRGQDVDLDLFSLNTDKHFAPAAVIQQLIDLHTYGQVVASQIASRESVVGALSHLMWGKGSYYVDRFYSESAARDLTQLLSAESYEVVILESLYLGPYIPILRDQAPYAHIILRSHNIEHELRSRQAASHRSSILKWYLHREIRKLKTYELHVMRAVDGIASVSHRETLWMKSHVSTIPIWTIPIGIKDTPLDQSRSIVPSTKLRIGFLGSLDWQPNIEGLQWFIEEVWQQLRSESTSDISFVVAGSRGRADLQCLSSDGVEYEGFVEDSVQFLKTLDVLVVPVFAGSGTRVKILEAMSVGRCVLTTSIGAEGLEVEHGRDILIGDDPLSWLHILQRLLSQQWQSDKIGQQGRMYVTTKHNIASLGLQLKEHIELLIQEQHIKHSNT